MSVGSGYDSFDDPYCYPGTSVLKNWLDLRDFDALEAFEHESVSAKAEETLPSGSFDPAHYRAIHHHLFQGVYDWAGKYRTVRIAKPGAMFCYPEHIEGQMELLFASLQSAPFTGSASATEFAQAAARFLGELNAIHPFRDGNGRTQLTFLFLLGEQAGHPLEMARVRAEPMMAAMVGSFEGDYAVLVGEIAFLVG
jgi:cell filamentation protein